MTYREAVKEALRRDGLSEQEINARIQYASFNVPAPHVDKPLKAGTEERVIAGLRAAHARIKALPPPLLELMSTAIHAANTTLTVKN